MAEKEKTMRIQFKTKSKGDGKTEAAGKVYTLPEEKAKAYIDRGLAVEVKGNAKTEAKGEEGTPKE